jgi:hypothetical protein
VSPKQPVDSALAHLDAGEREAISLASELQASLYLMDEFALFDRHTSILHVIAPFFRQIMKPVHQRTRWDAKFSSLRVVKIVDTFQRSEGQMTLRRRGSNGESHARSNANLDVAPGQRNCCAVRTCSSKLYGKTAPCCWVTAAAARVYLVDMPTKLDQAAGKTQTLNIIYVGGARQ